MTIVELIRFETSPAGTLSVMLINKELFGFALEPPKRENQKNVSCIPVGQYFCKRYTSEKYNRSCYAVHNVHDRQYISIHPGNTISDTSGCILPGYSVGHLNGKKAVLESVAAMDSLIVSCGDTFKLCISEQY